MPGQHTDAKVEVFWYAIDRDPETKIETRDPVMITSEVWDRRRGWTCERDLVASSPDENGSYWRRPTQYEFDNLDMPLHLSDAEIASGIREKRWLISVGREPGIAKRRTAVLLVESQR